jgi:uncharacterized protein with HEPN domain
MPRDQEYLLDMAEAARKILRFKEGMDLAALLADDKTQSAITHQLLIIGEAAKSLSASFTAQHPEIPWQAMARMRDRLVHHYRATKVGEVWKAADEDVPALLSFLESELPEAP